MRSKQRERAPKSTDTKPHTTHAPPPERPVSYDHYTPSDERAMFAQQCTRQLSASPPPVFSYPSLPAYNAYHPTSYTQLPLYHTVPSTYSEISFPYSESMPPVVPPALNIPRKPAYDEDIISPFSMSYASMAGIDLCPQSQQQQQPSLPVHFPTDDKLPQQLIIPFAF